MPKLDGKSEKNEDGRRAYLNFPLPLLLLLILFLLHCVSSLLKLEHLFKIKIILSSLISRFYM